MKVVVVAAQDASAGNRDTPAVGHDEYIGSLRLFTVLVSAALGRLLDQAVRAVQVQFLRVQLIFLDRQVSAEHILENTGPAPSAIMVIYRLPAEWRCNILYVNKHTSPLATGFQLMDYASEISPK